MKRLFNLGFLALAISFSVVACNSTKTENANDSTMVDTSVTDADTTMLSDTTAVDNTVTTDSANTGM